MPVEWCLGHLHLGPPRGSGELLQPSWGQPGGGGAAAAGSDPEGPFGGHSAGQGLQPGAGGADTGGSESQSQSQQWGGSPGGGSTNQPVAAISRDILLGGKGRWSSMVLGQPQSPLSAQGAAKAALGRASHLLVMLGGKMHRV